MIATVEDFKARVGDLEADNLPSDAVLKTLLEDAEVFLTAQYPNAGEQISRIVICSLVKRSIGDGGEAAKYSSYSYTYGNFSESFQSANPGGAFYLTKQEIALLEGTQTKKRGGFFSVKGVGY